MLVGPLIAPLPRPAATRADNAGSPIAASCGAPVQPATHAVRGVVMSVDASSLVIARSGHKDGALTFVLNSSTLREGTLAVGGTVSVRYRTHADVRVATAITAHPARHVDQSPRAAK
jgi:hypothetical protein